MKIMHGTDYASQSCLHAFLLGISHCLCISLLQIDFDGGLGSAMGEKRRFGPRVGFIFARRRNIIFR